MYVCLCYHDIQEAFAAGHTAALDMYRDPPKTYNYPKGSPYVMSDIRTLAHSSIR